MAIQVARRSGGDITAIIVYAVAFAIGITAVLLGALSHDAPRTKAGFIVLGLWAIASTVIAIIHKSTSQELVVRGSSDESGPRVDVLARIGVDGWAFWTIAGLLVAAIIAIIAW